MDMNGQHPIKSVRTASSRKAVAVDCRLCNFEITFSFVRNFMKLGMMHTIFKHVETAPRKFQTSYKKVKKSSQKCWDNYDVCQFSSEFY